ncbi:TBC1 domain family member 22A [Engraulis encrasicolus]|uniref:TBC1 domain family member 22A n=1 Tax=Engraulis encrasicolus TaxID=184585 RepID=UPI002FD47CD2
MSSEGNKKQFWKRNTAKVPGSIQHVYGAQHPPIDPLLHANLIKAGNKPPLTPGKPKKATTFQEFESITSDAWDVGDDDDELLAMAAQNLNIEVVMETANKVIENHSKLQERQQQQQQQQQEQQMDDVFELDTKEEEQEEEEVVTQEEVEEEVVDGGDGEEEEHEEEAAETAAELSFSSEAGSYSDSRLVKSFSEAPIGSPKELAGDKPLHRQQSLPHRPVIPLVARMADQNTSGTPAMTEREASRLDKFRQVLAGPNTDLDELRKLSWSGIPRQVRPITWKLLSGYLPANAERRESTLQRKRQEYFGFIEQYYDSRNDEHHQDTYRQIHIDIPRMSPETLVLQPKVTEIHIDIPRTNPLIPLFQQASVQEIFERILFIWAIRHPASGYVQGINDLVTPFFVVYVFEYIEEEVENFDVSSLQEEALRNIEADSFWCMSKLLDGIQDNYTFAQPGIQRKVKALEELVSRIDETVHRHMQQYEVEYLQFAFRWMNNLLMRELPLRCTIRLWDTYQAEPEGFSHFHLYVCAAFLVRWRKEILEERDFQVRGCGTRPPFSYPLIQYYPRCTTAEHHRFGILHQRVPVARGIHPQPSPTPPSLPPSPHAAPHHTAPRHNNHPSTTHRPLPPCAPTILLHPTIPSKQALEQGTPHNLTPEPVRTTAVGLAAACATAVADLLAVQLECPPRCTSPNLHPHPSPPSLCQPLWHGHQRSAPPQAKHPHAHAPTRPHAPTKTQTHTAPHKAPVTVCISWLAAPNIFL